LRVPSNKKIKTVNNEKHRTISITKVRKYEEMNRHFFFYFSSNPFCARHLFKWPAWVESSWGRMRYCL